MDHASTRLGSMIILVELVLTMVWLIIRDFRSRNCIWEYSFLHGISKLESQLRNWSMFEISRSSSHNALDQRSWDSAKSIDELMTSRSIVGRSDFPDYDMLDAMISVSNEKTSPQACSLPQKSKCRRAARSKIRPILTRKTTCLHDRRAFPCNRSSWSKDSQICSVYVCRMTTFKTSTFDGIKLYYLQATCLQMWSWKDCTSQNYRTLFSFRLVLALYDQETARTKEQTSYLRLKTSVKLHVDQMMTTRNFRVWSEVVERGAVTKSSKRKESLRWEESWRVFQWKAHGQCSEGDSCSFSHDKLV